MQEYDRGSEITKTAARQDRANLQRDIKALGAALMPGIREAMPKIDAFISDVDDQQNDSRYLDETAWEKLRDIAQILKQMKRLSFLLRDAVHDLDHPRFQPEP
jgi:hypothetical protein